MKENEKTFNQAFHDMWSQVALISGFSANVEKAFSHSELQLISDNEQMISFAAGDPLLNRVFNEPEKIGNPSYRKDLAKSLTESSVASAKRITKASAIVFYHSVFEIYVLELLKVCLLSEPNCLVEKIKNKKESIDLIRTDPRETIIRRKSVEYLECIEKESLMKKLDLFLEIASQHRDKFTEFGFPPEADGFKYSRGEVEKYDQTRHDVVHHKAYESEIDIFEEMSTWHYKISGSLAYMIAVMYGLQIDTGYSKN
jgi:hypothetical protein